MSETNGSSAKHIGIEVSAKAVTVVGLDAAGNLIEAFHTPPAQSGSIQEQIASIANDVSSKFGEVGEIGIALPGLISTEKMRVAYSTHFPEHSSVDIKEEVHAATG